MATADWTELTDSLSSSDVKRGVTGGITTPSGGGTFAYGMRSTTVVSGAVGLFTNQSNFAPTPTNKGASIKGCILRATSAGADGCSPSLFVGMQTSDVLGQCYLLGLSEGDPFRIVLAKGRFIDGCPDAAPGTSGVLRRSTQTFPVGTWLHLRLDQRVNPNGDVVLTVYRNNLAVNAVGSPVWVAEPGLEQFIDDALGANSGTLPFTQGRMGFGARFEDTHRRAYWDHLDSAREL